MCIILLSANEMLIFTKVLETPRPCRQIRHQLTLRDGWKGDCGVILNAIVRKLLTHPAEAFGTITVHKNTSNYNLDQLQLQIQMLPVKGPLCVRLDAVGPRFLTTSDFQVVEGNACDIYPSVEIASLLAGQELSLEVRTEQGCADKHPKWQTAICWHTVMPIRDNMMLGRTIMPYTLIMEERFSPIDGLLEWTLEQLRLEYRDLLERLSSNVWRSVSARDRDGVAMVGVYYETDTDMGVLYLVVETALSQLSDHSIAIECFKKHPADEKNVLYLTAAEPLAGQILLKALNAVCRLFNEPVVR